MTEAPRATADSPRPLQEPTHKPLLSPPWVSRSEMGLSRKAHWWEWGCEEGPGKARETGSGRVGSEKGT